MMPYFIRHYGQFARVVILANNCTDNTVGIAESLGADVIELDIPDEFDDQRFINIRNNIWKGSKTNWVMWADADEFIYHPNLVEILETTKATAILPAFYNMYHDRFPTTEGQIYDEVKLGSRWGGAENIYGKVNVFKMPDITEINYNPGCHHADLKGNVILDSRTEIKTLHMRNMGKEFVVARNARNSARLSVLNRKNGWGLYVDRPQEETERLFDEEMSQTTVVI
jgi:glycosyltransferase involved in cell wall biosynthesis